MQAGNPCECRTIEYVYYPRVGRLDAEPITSDFIMVVGFDFSANKVLLRADQLYSALRNRAFVYNIIVI
jgi:hypothetical protein